jgi:hypothetical protein
MKCDAFMYQAALLGDAALLKNIQPHHARHPNRALGTGVHGSHALMALPYWSHVNFVHPDTMHTWGNEMTSISAMFLGNAYSGKQAANNAHYEVNFNHRFNELRPILAQQASIVAATALAEPQPSGARGTLTEHQVRVRKALAKVAKTVPTVHVFPPGVLTEAQHATFLERGVQLSSLGLLPSSMCGIPFMYFLKTPKFIKTAEHLVMLGPILKYLSQGLLARTPEAVLFNYIDILSKMWAYKVKTDALDDLCRDLVRALADMELHFPAWELDMNRHNVLHVAQMLCHQKIPLWVLTAFPSERLWYKLVQYVT